MSNAYKAYAGKDGATKKEGLKILAGIMLNHSIVGGVLGGVAMEPVRVIISLIASLTEDDDDPFDIDEWTREFLAEYVGVQAGELVARGLPHAVGFDMSGRVGLNNLAMMELQEGRSARDTWANLVISLGGPMAAVGGNFFASIDYARKGSYYRMFESATPKLIRDAIKTARYADEGLKDYTGNTIVADDEFGVEDYIYQVIGLAPSRVTETYEARTAQKAKETRAANRSKLLKERWRRADAAGKRAIVRDDIRSFNRTNPEFAISGKSLREGLQTQRERERGTKAGAYTDKRQVRKIGENYNL